MINKMIVTIIALSLSFIICGCINRSDTYTNRLEESSDIPGNSISWSQDSQTNDKDKQIDTQLRNDSSESFHRGDKCDIEIDEIELLFDMKMDEVISYLGDDYRYTWTGPEFSFEGLCYDSFGLVLVFDDRESLVWIDTMEPFEINGAHTGMSLLQVQERLGDGAIFEDWWEVPSNTINCIEYIFGKCRYRFSAFEQNGNTWMSIFWYREKLQLEFIDTLFDLTKADVMEIYGIYNYNDYILGESPEVVETELDNYPGYYFREHGLTFAFDLNDKVSFLILDRNIEINGAGSGMSFNEIQKLWGYSKISEYNLDMLECKLYSIEYEISNYRFRFISSEPNNDDSRLYIFSLYDSQ